MTRARGFQDLEVWKKAHAIVLMVYRMTADFPKAEQYGLTAQIRRAAMSVPANIAEGFVKHGRSDKVRFYNVAQGSLAETRYFLMLAHDLDYADTADVLENVEELSRMLDAYVSAVAHDRYRLMSLFLLLASCFSLLP